MPIGVSDKKTYFSHLLVYIIDSLSFLKDILCCSQTGMNKRQWPGLMSMTPYSLNQYSKPRWKMKGREKKSKREAFSSSFFFWVNKRIRVLSDTLANIDLSYPQSPPPPSPLNLQKRIWQSDRTFSFRSDVLFIIFSVFVTTLISPYLLRHGIFGGFKVFFFLTEGKDTNSGACFLLLGGRDFRQVPSLLWRPGFKLLFCS